MGITDTSMNNYLNVTDVADKFGRAIREILRINNSAGFCTGSTYPKQKTYDFHFTRFGTGEVPSLDLTYARDSIRVCAEACVPGFIWDPAYDSFAAWAEHTDGRGLFLYGSVGTGKTFLSIIYAALAYVYHGALFTIVTGQELNNRADDIMRDRFLLVDDAGVEDVRNNYGSRSYVLSDLVDMAERRGAFLIITTNLSIGELQTKYGHRTYDRLTELCKPICFTGASHRTGGRRYSIPVPPVTKERAEVFGIKAFKRYWATVPDEEKYATFTTEDGRVVPLHPVASIARLAFGTI